jgi:hypothetical protein
MPLATNPKALTWFRHPRDAQPSDPPGAGGLLIGDAAAGSARGSHPPAPEFCARFLTEGDLDQADELLERAQASADRRVRRQACMDLLSLGLVGVRNLVDPQGREVVAVADLPRAYTALELWELAIQMIRSVRLAEADLGKSASPWEYSAAMSAATAGPQGGASTTSPAADPSKCPAPSATAGAPPETPATASSVRGGAQTGL